MLILTIHVLWIYTKEAMNKANCILHVKWLVQVISDEVISTKNKHYVVADHMFYVLLIHTKKDA